MNNLFTLATNETTTGSVYFLNSIFGNVGNVLVGTGPALLGTMFQVFNTSVLALGSLIVTYTTVVSILATAHEGEALGKRFHTLWIPARTVTGIAALVPTAGGYSYLQIALMWFIIQGVGAADTLWTSVVEYVSQGNTTAATAPGSSSLQTQFGQLFQGLVCQAAAKANYGSGYYCSDNASSSFCTATDTWSAALTASQVKTDSAGNKLYNMGPSGACGVLTLKSSQDASTVGDAKVTAFTQVISTLGALATQLVAVDYAYNGFINNSSAVPSWITQYCSDIGKSGSQCIASAFSGYPTPTASNTNKGTVLDLYWKYGLLPTAGSSFLATAANLYSGIVGAAATANAKTNTNSLSAVKSTAEANGWIYAGGFFYYIAKAGNSNYANAGSITVTAPDVSSTNLTEDTEKALTNVAQVLVSNVGMSVAATNNLGVDTSCGGSSYAGATSSLCSAILGAWINDLSGSSGANITTNPVVRAQQTGSTILLIVEIIVPIFIAMQLALGLAGGVYIGVSVGIASVITAGATLIPIAMFFLSIFLGVGLTLAVYIPMIPYMLFTFGAINWLIATIETMIAAPIVAIGLLHPEGGHEIWGRAEQSLMLLLNIFLRPSLMIFGLISGMLMSFTVIMMINYAFLNVIEMVSSGPNLLEMIFFMVLYTSLFTTSINKCFDLIHLVPDKILRWLGGGSEQFGEGGGLDKVGQSFQGASGQAEKGAGEAVAGGKAAGGQVMGASEGARKAAFEEKHGAGAGFGGVGGENPKKPGEPEE